MDEIIASILDAEKRAEEIVRQSAEKAKRIKEDADAESEKIKNGAVAVFKLRRTSAIKEAEKKADALYEEVITKGKKDAEAVAVAAAAGADKQAKEILKDILG